MPKVTCWNCDNVIDDFTDHVRWEVDYYEYHGYEVECPLCNTSCYIWETEEIEKTEKGEEGIAVYFYYGDSISPNEHEHFCTERYDL